MGLVIETKRLLINSKWRRINKRNHTWIGRPTDINQIVVGDFTYGMINALNEGNNYYLKIGKCCSIAPEVIFVVDSDHELTTISTYPFSHWIINSRNKDAVSKGDIVLRDDVWIGARATILSGVTIGQGAVVAAGAVVNKNVAPYSIVGGVPAKVIKYRFEPIVIDYLLTLDYDALTENIIMQHIDDLHKSIDTLSIEAIKNYYSWFPKNQEL